MMKLLSLRRGAVAAASLAAMLGTSAPAVAADPDFTVVFPAGWACVGFDLQIDGWAGNKRPDLTFKEDKNGYVRSISAGTGSTLLYTNLSTGKSMTTKANGSVVQTRTYLPDGTQIVKLTGHTVLIMFPTDTPPGPSTTLYVGRVVYQQNLFTGVTTILSSSGNATDVCAALS
jgi:hypothetical protein